jgi:aspartate aminotransferase
MRLAARVRRFAFEAGTGIMAEAASLEAAGRDIVHLDIGEPDFPTPPNIVGAAEAAIAGGHTHYAPPGGLGAARAAIAEHVSRTRRTEVLPRQVVVTSGSTQGLMFAILATVDEGSEVLLPDPGYTIYPSLVEMAGGVPVTVPLREDRGHRLDAAELRAKVSPRTRLIVVNSPNNPTGGILTRDDLEVVAEVAERHDLLVLSDEVYGALAYGHERAPSIMSVPGMAGRTICLDSFSKTYAMCGWRLGFMVAPLELAARLEALMFCGGLCASPFVQRAAIEAVTSAASAAAVRRMRAEFRRRRDVMVEGLNRIPGFRCHQPEGAFYCFPDIRETGVSDQELARRLLVEGGVAVMPGSLFGERGAGHLRFSYAASMDQIHEGLRRVESVVGAVSSPA